MRKTQSIFCAAILAGAACADPAAPNSDAPAAITSLPRALSEAEQAIVAGSGPFAFNLLREVNRGWRDKNVVISPLSATIALGMLMNGTGTTTFAELRQALGFGSRSQDEINVAYRDLVGLLKGLDPAVNIGLSNALWYHRSFGPSVERRFLSNLREYFAATSDGLIMGTPESVDTINAWARRETNGLVERVIESTIGAKVMLANTVFFKGTWNGQFEAARPAPFHVRSGSPVNVPTMVRKGPGRYHMSREGTQTIEVPYGGDAFVMTVLIPPPAIAFDEWVEALTADRFVSEGINGFVDHVGEVHLPKFKLVWSDTLQQPLRRLGIQEVFEPGSDFAPLSAQYARDLFVTYVKQDAVVDVDEEGTRAAAVTVIATGLISQPSPPPAIVRVDRPFVFAIRERLTGTVLFLGKVVDPRL